MQSIAIIIPAYNEEQRIKNTLTTYYDYFSALSAQQQLAFEAKAEGVLQHARVQ